jgi:hypothetical protein
MKQTLVHDSSLTSPKPNQDIRFHNLSFFSIENSKYYFTATSDSIDLQYQLGKSHFIQIINSQHSFAFFCLIIQQLRGFEKLNFSQKHILDSRTFGLGKKFIDSGILGHS